MNTGTRAGRQGPGPDRIGIQGLGLEYRDQSWNTGDRARILGILWNTGTRILGTGLETRAGIQEPGLEDRDQCRNTGLEYRD